MTAIELSHFYLETGEAISNILAELQATERAHPNWLQDAKDVFENNNPLGHFSLRDITIRNMQKNYLSADFLATLRGLRQLDLLFYRKKHYFDDSRPEEEHLSISLKHALDVFYRYADAYLEDKLASITEEDRLLFFKKLRQWSTLKAMGADASNEISTLFCKEATQKPHPVLLDVCLAIECTEQASFQTNRHSKELSDEQAKILNHFASETSVANLDFWNI
jgi:hypothetical protein